MIEKTISRLTRNENDSQIQFGKNPSSRTDRHAVSVVCTQQIEITIVELQYRETE